VARTDDLLFAIHRDLPREGPGDDASTRRALACITAVCAPRRIVDIGCGPGAQTVELAMATTAHVLALDIHSDYLQQLRVRADAAGVSARVAAVRSSMARMPILPESADLLWAEGSIYIIGFAEGLRTWRPLLRQGGCIALTHLSWLSDSAPVKPRAFWARHYPAMTTVDENLRVAHECGYDVLDRFTLPESAWWDDYYAPLERRLVVLRQQYRHDAEAASVIDTSQEEIDLYREFSQCYGYVFYVLRRP
jgi:ubiquinone/menaquinone biosynthesis C-methylase UbiE